MFLFYQALQLFPPEIKQAPELKVSSIPPVLVMHVGRRYNHAFHPCCFHCDHAVKRIFKTDTPGGIYPEAGGAIKVYCRVRLAVRQIFQVRY